MKRVRQKSKKQESDGVTKTQKGLPKSNSVLDKIKNNTEDTIVVLYDKDLCHCEDESIGVAKSIVNRSFSRYYLKFGGKWNILLDVRKEKSYKDYKWREVGPIAFKNYCVFLQSKRSTDYETTASNWAN